MTTRRRPIVPITELEHSAFCKTEDELPAKPLAEELAVNVRWQQIPTEYLHFTADELDERIHEVRRKLGATVTVLGHHYQREEVIKYADFQGDSFLLSQQAASRPEADYIIFCGVHFMAETACVLAAEHQRVILPNITAGCSMADMAPMDDVDDAWEDLMEVLGPDEIVPVTYMNSIAGIKALCGRNGGAVCTSSNAEAVLKWAFDQGNRVLFLPDQHLGRNTALKMGVPLDEMVVWNPFRNMGGNTPEQLRRAKMVLWQGHCSVHTRFTVKQIELARQRFPDVNVLVHPECVMETVQAADLGGFHRVHPQPDQQRARGQCLGRGDGDQPGQSPGHQQSRQDGLLPRPGDLPLLHHVPHSPGIRAVGDGVAAGGTGDERDHRARGHPPGCAGGPGPDAVAAVAAQEQIDNERQNIQGWANHNSTRTVGGMRTSAR